MKRLTIIGTVTKDSESRVSAAGRQMVTFTLAVSDNSKFTDYINVILMEKEIDPLHEGERVLVIGNPSVEAYLNKEQKPVGRFRVFAQEIIVLNNVNTIEEITEDLAIPF